ncbi:MAG: 5'-nucleotidase, partial [Pyramidobacter sp.]|nr:5'-nucleotidase [Pyramidobacter sp.]
EPIAPYLKSYETDLFLSANGGDVQQAIDAGVAAGVILPGNLPENPRRRLDQIRIAFDGDAVLFSADSERIFQREGIDAFFENEQTMADVPLREGPFAPFLRTLAHIQSLFAEREEAPIRTALVTSRNAPAHERPIKTLRAWGVRVDEAHFLGGAPKAPVLKAFGAHIFFDDQPRHAMPASEVVPAAVVPYPEGEDPMG